MSPPPPRRHGTARADPRHSAFDVATHVAAPRYVVSLILRWVSVRRRVIVLVCVRNGKGSSAAREASCASRYICKFVLEFEFAVAREAGCRPDDLTVPAESTFG